MLSYSERTKCNTGRAVQGTAAAMRPRYRKPLDVVHLKAVRQRVINYTIAQNYCRLASIVHCPTEAKQRQSKILFSIRRLFI